MPMGPYKDWDDCVRKNSGKDNPRRYCGYIRARTEGRNREAAIEEFGADPEAEAAFVESDIAGRLQGKVTR